MSNPLQILAGVAIVFFLPGYAMVNMLFPRRGELDPEYDIVYRITLGMGLSVVIAIMVGFGLNAISSEGQGYVSAGPLWLTLGSVTIIFGVAGWYRGAYPSLGALHPSLFRPTSAELKADRKASDFSRRRRTGKMLMERESLLRDIERYTERASTSNLQRKMYYRKRVDHARERIEQINEELSERSKEEG